MIKQGVAYRVSDVEKLQYIMDTYWHVNCGIQTCIGFGHDICLRLQGMGEDV